MANAPIDASSRQGLLAFSSSDGVTPIALWADPITHRLLVDNSGSAVVTTVSVVSANGFAGSVANPTTTPAITLSTTVNSPVLAGNGTAIAAATTTGSGSTVVLNSGPTFLATKQTVTTMGAQALNGALGNVFTRTLAGSEVFTQSGFSTGQFFIVEVTQGSGTSYTVTWFAGVTWVTSGATAPVQTTTSNGITTYGFRCTGTNTFLGYLVGTQ